MKSLKETMLSFCRIQRDMEQTEAAAKHAINQVPTHTHTHTRLTTFGPRLLG